MHTYDMQGGVGKTTAAVQLIRDSEVRAAFTKLLWVSVSQEVEFRDPIPPLLACALSEERSARALSSDTLAPSVFLLHRILCSSLCIVSMSCSIAVLPLNLLNLCLNFLQPDIFQLLRVLYSQLK